MVCKAASFTQITNWIYKNYFLYQSHEKFKHQNTNFKWFDQPFDRLTVLSRVEGLTTLSQVEGQIPMTEIQNSKLLGSS